MISGELFAELALMSTQDIPLRDAFHGLLAGARKATGARNAMVALLDEDNGTLDLSFGCGIDWEQYRERKDRILTIQEGEGVISEVASNRVLVRLGKVEESRAYRRIFDFTKSELAVPVIDRYDRLRGVLNLESEREDFFSDEHEQVAKGIASLLSVLVMREDRRRREEALIQIGGMLDQGLEENDLIQKVLGITDEVLLFHSCSIFLYDPRRELYVLRGSTGSLQTKVGEVGYQANEGCTGWVCAQGESLLVDDPLQDPRWKGQFIEFPTEQIASYLCVPIIIRNRSIGALRVVRKKSSNLFLDNRFMDDDRRLLLAIADQLATGLDSIRAFGKALHTERLAAWGEMSAKSSHMIGNRIFALRGDMNELHHQLKSNPVDVPMLEGLARSLSNNVTRIEEILQDFRDYLTASQISKVRADLNFVVQEAVLEVFPKRGKIKLIFNLDPAVPEVELDMSRMKRAIGELVENSLNHADEGEMHVQTTLATPSLLRKARLVGRGEFVAITIMDQGPGVRPEDKESIFEPFYSTRVRGMGLGLSIVRGIAEAHGGTVLETGEPGEGAKFVLLLPVSVRR